MIPGRRVDPYDPQASEVPFPVASITIGIGQRFFDCHAGLTNEILSPTPITGGLGKEILSFLSGVNRPFYSGHLLTPFYLEYLKMIRKISLRFILRGGHHACGVTPPQVSIKYRGSIS
jgi:hypothetical protein